MNTLTETPPTVQYRTQYTGYEDAERNLLLRIDVGENSATVHCREFERVGAHKKRTVTFWPDKACKLQFDEAGVFGLTDCDLPGGKPTTLPIGDEVGVREPASTHCAVYVEGTKPAEFHKSPPRIVVP